MRIAITRGVSPGIARCELTHIERKAIDLRLAESQHRCYEKLLADLGCRVRRLPPEPDLPDCVFVEDAAVVLDELGIIARPGAASRRPETAAVAAALAPHRRLVQVRGPGTIDGGDVLVVGSAVFVGLSGRSNPSGFEQIRAALEPLGYSVTSIPVHGCLHLKSAVAQVGRDVLLVNRSWVDVRLFPGMCFIDVDPAEPLAANALRVGETVVYPAAFPRTGRRLTDRGIDVAFIDVSELAKAEGGVTCCSVVFELEGGRRRG